MKPIQSGSISLHRLGRELGVTVRSIVAKCRSEGLPIGDPNEQAVRISRGLAETIRVWHRDEMLEPFQDAAQRELNLLSHMADEAQRENSFAAGFGAELDAMVHVLREHEIDPLSMRGRRLLVRAWKLFESWGFDFEKWMECRHCHAQFIPVRNSAFVYAYVDATVKRRRDQRKSDFRLFHCADCGGMRYERKESEPSDSAGQL